MLNRWNPDTAPQGSILDQCVYASRLLGADPGLVLHGGGNSSAKGTLTDITGDEVDVIYVKGSGWDLATIESQGFAPLRMDRLLSLLKVNEMSDADMVNEFRQASLLATSPVASIEALLHAFLPYKAVLHSHADAIVTVTNQPDGRQKIQELFGDKVIIVDYVKPGFDLAKTVVEQWEEQSSALTVGVVLMNHGLFTFADEFETAYGNHIGLLNSAEDYISSRACREVPASPAAERALPVGSYLELAGVRSAISRHAGRPMIVRQHNDSRIQEFVARQDLGTVANQGPATMEHVLRTKRVPSIGLDIDAYAADYEDYFTECSKSVNQNLVRLDPAPRIVLDQTFGMLAAGESAKASAIAADIYSHTIDIIQDASAMGGYQSLSPEQIFDVEYWELEQAKLTRGNTRKPLAGEVAIVTGAASGIGRACAAALLDAGAAVVGIDLSENVVDTFSGSDWLGVPTDVTSREDLARAIETTVRTFGGVDILVPAAGIFAASAPIAELDTASWDKSMSVNTDALFTLFQLAHPLLKLSPAKGRVVLVASKNVHAPGPGASAYSASKAAATQLARVAALEWASDGIRVNMVNPDAVFDTALWTPALLAERAAKYGMSIDEYKKRNLLRTEVTSAQVGQVVKDLCTGHYSATTGAQIPIDGGNERVI